MVPEITRRRLLAGSGAALGTGVVGTGLFAPTWLPDTLTDFLLGVYPEPPARLWWPDISDAHADEAVAHLEDTVERANALTERIDVDSLDEDLAFHLDNDPSGGHLEGAREESDPWKRLFSAMQGLKYASETVGYAKVALDEADPDRLAERGARLREEAEAVRDSLGDYPVSDPGRDLGYLYFVERELGFAQINLHAWDTGDDGDAEEYSSHSIASAWGSQAQSEQRLRNARYFRDLYRENLGDDARPYADTLDDALADLTDAIEEFPTREEMFTRVEDELELTHETPYGVARWKLMRLCYDNDFRAGFEEDHFRSGHTVQRVVETARALLARRAHEFALSELTVSPEDTGYDSGHALREKRRAVETFRSVRDEFDSPFAGVLAQEAADRIGAGDIGVGEESYDGDQPPWRDRVEATVNYLIGTGKLRELDGVVRTVLDR